MSRRNFGVGVAGLTTSLAIGGPRGVADDPLDSSSGTANQPSGNEPIVVLAPTLDTTMSWGSALTTALTASSSRGVATDARTGDPGTEPWHVAIVPSLEDAPVGASSDDTGLLRGIARPVDHTAIGTVQEAAHFRLTIASAEPSVYFRSTALRDAGFASIESLEDFTAAGHYFSYSDAFESAVLTTRASTSWMTLVLSFVPTEVVVAGGKADPDALRAGYAALDSLIGAVHDSSVWQGTRKEAVSAFCAGRAPILLDEATLSADVMAQASAAGISDVVRVRLPAGPFGRQEFDAPGLDVVVSTAGYATPSVIDFLADLAAALTIPADGQRVFTRVQALELVNPLADPGGPKVTAGEVQVATDIVSG